MVDHTMHHRKPECLRWWQTLAPTPVMSIYQQLEGTSCASLGCSTRTPPAPQSVSYKRGGQEKGREKRQSQGKQTKGMKKKELETVKEALSHSETTYNNTSLHLFRWSSHTLQIHLKYIQQYLFGAPYHIYIYMHTMCMYTCMKCIM